VNKILVTGANGFIGSALVLKLKAYGWNVFSVTSLEGDIADKKTLEKFLQQDINHVIHLASKTFIPDSLIAPDIFYHTNVLGTVNILEFCRINCIPLTYVSAYVYGRQGDLPISEDAAIQPNNPYAMTKWLAEQICAYYAKNYNFPITTIRPFNVFGIGQSENFLIPTIINQIFGDGTTIVVKDLMPKRDYIYLDDLLTALIATIKKTEGYNVYNIGSGLSLSVKEIIDTIQNVVGTKKNIVSDNIARINEIDDVAADIKKVTNDFGWQPFYSFREGIEIIIKSEISRRKNEISLRAN